MLNELELRKSYLPEKKIETIYFGGGTPSILSAQEIASFINAVQKKFSVAVTPEITLEANPDDLTKTKIQELKSVGINRLSIGIQSFREADLQLMNRAHSAAEALRCLEDVFTAGFDNITLDLIYGIPGLSMEDWKKNLQQAIAFPVNHFSAYCLTVEKGTALHHFVEEKKVAPVDEEMAEQQFLFMHDFLKENGFLHYEVSNFAKENCLSQHNTSYWKGVHYLGIGPSAHSFNGFSRSYNIASNKRYIDAIANHESFSETEILSEHEQYNEFIMTGLRTMWGVNVKELEKRFGTEKAARFNAERKNINPGYCMSNSEEQLILNSKGFLFADRIASDLFLL